MSIAPRIRESGQLHRPLALRENFLWTLVGNVVYAACQWGMLVVLAKMGSPEMVGEFALALAITAPIVIGAGLSLRGVQVTDAASEYAFGDYLSLRLITTGVAVLAIMAVLLFSRHPWHIAIVVFIIGLSKAFEAISDIFYGLLQKHDRMDRIACSMIIKGLLSLAAVACAVYFSSSLLLGVCGLAAVWLLILLSYDIPSSVKILRAVSDSKYPAASAMDLLRLRWRPHELLTLMQLAIPVGIVMALASFNTNIPRYFIERHLGLRELGIFAALVYPMAAGTTVVAALGQSASSRLARYYAARDDRAFSWLMLKLLGISSLLGGGGVLLVAMAGHPILLALYKPEYADYVNVFLWLSISAAITYAASILGYGMTAARYFRAQLPVFVAVTLVTILASAILVPSHRLLGAAVAVTLAAVCQAAGSAAVVGHALWRREVK